MPATPETAVAGAAGAAGATRSPASRNAPRTSGGARPGARLTAGSGPVPVQVPDALRQATANYLTRYWPGLQALASHLGYAPVSAVPPRASDAPVAGHSVRREDPHTPTSPGAFSDLSLATVPEESASPGPSPRSRVTRTPHSRH